jgi:hypothetical protein
MFSVNCFSCSVQLIKAIQWLAMAGSDLSLTGLDLGSVIFYFIEINYVPWFWAEERKFGYVPRLTEEHKFDYVHRLAEEHKLLYSSVSHGRGT